MLLTNSISELKHVNDLSGLTRICELMADEYRQLNGKTNRSNHAQFFTPSEVAEFMASLLPISNSSLNILEPGAGFGILSVSLLDKLSKNSHVNDINLTTYEVDSKIHRHLELVLEKARLLLMGKNVMMGIAPFMVV